MFKSYKLTTVKAFKRCKNLYLVEFYADYGVRVASFTVFEVDPVQIWIIGL